MKRLFLAIRPPEVVCHALRELREDLRGFHWVEPQNIHLTLKFIGEVDSGIEEEICRTMQEVGTEPFILPVEGVGMFPPRGRPFVVWAGVGSGHPRLFGMQKEIDDRLFRIGIEPERHIYTPHITLARCREAHPETVRQYVKRHKDFLAPPFKVESFGLFSSHTVQGRSVYTLLKEWNIER